MGILGSAQCYWCWTWVNNPFCPHFEDACDVVLEMGTSKESFLPDFAPLCDRCLCLWMKRRRPPWKPTAVGRAAMVVDAALGKKICPYTILFTVATFLEPWDKP